MPSQDIRACAEDLKSKQRHRHQHSCWTASKRLHLCLGLCTGGCVLVTNSMVQLRSPSAAQVRRLARVSVPQLSTSPGNSQNPLPCSCGRAGDTSQRPRQDTEKRDNQESSTAVTGQVGMAARQASTGRGFSLVVVGSLSAVRMPSSFLKATEKASSILASAACTRTW